MSQVRMEQGCFMYRYEPCNVGNIRKMVILLPSLMPLNLSEEQRALFQQIQNLPESVYLMARSKHKIKFEAKVWRPVKVSLLSKLQKSFNRLMVNSANGLATGSICPRR